MMYGSFFGKKNDKKSAFALKQVFHEQLKNHG